MGPEVEAADPQVKPEGSLPVKEESGIKEDVLMDAPPLPSASDATLDGLPFPTIPSIPPSSTTEVLPPLPLIVECSQCGSSRYFSPPPSSPLPSPWQCSLHTDPSQSACSSPPIQIGRIVNFPLNVRPTFPFNFTQIGLQIVSDELMETVYAHPKWTKYETLALLYLVKQVGFDYFSEDCRADPILSVRHSVAECEARLFGLLATAAIYQQNISSLTMKFNPYISKIDPDNPPTERNLKVKPRKSFSDFEPKAKPERISARLASQKRRNYNYDDDGAFERELDSDDDKPRGRAASKARARSKYREVSSDEDDDFLDLDDAQQSEEPEYIWKVEKILADRTRRVKRGEEDKVEEDDIQDQQTIESTITSVEEHRHLRFRSDKDKDGDDPTSPSKRRLELDPQAEYVTVKEYLIKIEGQSYLHCEWNSRKSMVEKFGEKTTKDKILRWSIARNKVIETNMDRFSGDPFDPRYTQVDRVIASKWIELEQEEGGPPIKEEEKRVEMFLVKWQGLSYSESTWEVREDVDNDNEIARFRRCNRPLPQDRDVAYTAQEFMARRKSWYKESPLYKNKMKLRDYQVDGLNWLIAAWHDDRNCILADEMGLGKTVQVVTLFEHLRKVEFIAGPFLVIVPLGTLSHWKKEIETWTDMNVVIYHDPHKGAQTREFIRENEFFYGDTKQVKFNICVTTYEVTAQDAEILATIQWKHCVVDEGHRIKARASKLLEALKLLNCNRRLLLTGTPIQNNTTELYSLLNFLEPDIFSSQSKFEQQFGTLQQSEQVQALQQRIRPFMLRRMKEAVEKSIPPKEETIIEIEMTTLQWKYYGAIYKRNFAILRKGSSHPGNMPRLVNIEMELRKVCNHPWLVAGAEEAEIPPGTADLEYMQKTITASGKLVLLDKLMPKLKADGHRVLIFSQMIPILDIIQEYCIYKGWGYERLDGSVRGHEREAALDRFNAPDSDRFAFLLTTRAGGVGLNLATADTVIIFDSDWNPQADMQAQARAHRIGQKNKVNVYRLVTRNTYESAMFLRASKKLGLDHAVLTNLELGKGEIDENDKDSIDKILKLGAYGILDEEETKAKSIEFEQQNIDDILKTRAHVIQLSKTARPQGEGDDENGVGEEGNGLTAAEAKNEEVKSKFRLNYTKMKFSGEEGRESMDLDDPRFWDQVLGDKVGDYVIPPDELLGQLTDRTAFIDSKSKTSFWDSMKKTVENALKRRSAGEDVPEIDSVVILLIQVCEISEFTKAQREQAKLWEEEFSKKVKRAAAVGKNLSEVEALKKLKTQSTRERSNNRRKVVHSSDEDFESDPPSSDSEFELNPRKEPEPSALGPGGRRKGKAAVALNLEVCSLCHLSGSLLGCEAGCFRWFHLDSCLNMTKEDVPPLSENWICDDCMSGSHVCHACGERGSIEEADGVRRCVAPQCGRFYHVACVKRYPTTFFTDSGGETFRCPIHICSRCDTTDANVWMVFCLTCPTGMHVKCIGANEIRLTRKDIYCDVCAERESLTERGAAAVEGAQIHSYQKPIRPRQKLRGQQMQRFRLPVDPSHPPKRRGVPKAHFKPGTYTIKFWNDGEVVFQVRQPMFLNNDRIRKRRRTRDEMAEARRMKEERRKIREELGAARFQRRQERKEANGGISDHSEEEDDFESEDVSEFSYEDGEAKASRAADVEGNSDDELLVEPKKRKLSPFESVGVEGKGNEMEKSDNDDSVAPSGDGNQRMEMIVEGDNEGEDHPPYVSSDSLSGVSPADVATGQPQESQFPHVSSSAQMTDV